MNIEERIQKYRAIEAYRQRPLIVYATSTRPGVHAEMASDSVREFLDQLEKIPAEVDAIDVLIHSHGGDPLVAWKLMATLRERFKKVGALVPFAAFSAATLFALGADEIVMHPYASLGPIDPQIQVRSGSGTRSFAYEELGAFLNFLRDDVKLTEQDHIAAIVEKLFASMDPVVVGAAKRASELSSEVAERLLSTHLDDERKAKQIAVNLNKNFFSHGDAVTRRRARKLDLQVAESSTVLEGLIWDAFLGIESFLELRLPFDPVSILMNHPEAKRLLAPVPALRLPADIPPPVAQQVWNTVINSALQACVSAGLDIPYEFINAIIESPRAASTHKSHGDITGRREPDGKIWFTVTPHGNGSWQSQSIPDAELRSGHS